MYAHSRRFIGFRLPILHKRAHRTSGAALYCAVLLALLAPQVAIAGPEYECPGTRYVYTSDVHVPDPANTTTSCRTVYDGGTVANNGTFNTSTPFSLGSSIWTAITNAFGQLLQIINSVGTTWNMGPLPGKTESIGSAGNQTRFTYDSMDRVQSTVAPVSPTAVTTNYMYDTTYTNQVKVTDRDGNTTTYAYDANGRPDTVTPSGGNTTKYEYDSQSRPTKAEEQPPGSGRTQTYIYDDLNRTVTRTDNMGPPPTTYTYDAMNRVTQMTDTLGNATTYEYDVTTGNLLKVTETTPPPPDPDRIFQYQYDLQGRVTELRDSFMDPGNLADDRYTCYQYDSAGRLTEYTSQDTESTCSGGIGMTTRFTYDARGRLASITDPQGAQAQLTYVPVPGSLFLLGLGLGALVLRRRA